MKIKEDLLTDEQVGYPTLNVGVHTITGLAVKRRFKSLFSDSHTKEHTITYEEWQIGLDGNIYEEFYRIKTYKVVDDLDNQSLKYTQWVNALKPSLEPAFNNTLQNVVPIVSESGFVQP